MCLAVLFHNLSAGPACYSTAPLKIGYTRFLNAKRPSCYPTKSIKELKKLLWTKHLTWHQLCSLNKVQSVWAQSFHVILSVLKNFSDFLFVEPDSQKKSILHSITWSQLFFTFTTDIDLTKQLILYKMPPQHGLKRSQTLQLTKISAIFILCNL